MSFLHNTFKGIVSCNNLGDSWIRVERNKGIAVSSRQDWIQEQLDNLELGLL